MKTITTLGLPRKSEEGRAAYGTFPLFQLEVGDCFVYDCTTDYYSVSCIIDADNSYAIVLDLSTQEISEVHLADHVFHFEPTIEFREKVDLLIAPHTA